MKIVFVFFPLLKGICRCKSMEAIVFHGKVQIGNDQEKAQSEKDSHSKNQGGKKQTNNAYTMKTFRKPKEQLFSQ